MVFSIGFWELRGRFSQGGRLRAVNFSKVIYHCVFNEVDISFKYSRIYLNPLGNYVPLKIRRLLAWVNAFERFVPEIGRAHV